MQSRKKLTWALIAGLVFQGYGYAQEANPVATVSSSLNQSTVENIFDRDVNSSWKVSAADLSSSQWLMFTLTNGGDVDKLTITSKGLSKKEVENLFDIYITYDPMNLGAAVQYRVIEQDKKFVLSFTPKYGAHIRLDLKTGITKKPFELAEVDVSVPKPEEQQAEIVKNRDYMDPNLPTEERVKRLLAVMTPAEKIDLLKESWGIAGNKRLGIPAVMKVEALHGFSYGSGATIFPQSIGMGATWNQALIEQAAIAIGEETKSANAVQAWSPVLDVAQDARWGRVEETYGEDPILVAKIGGAWIKGYQSQGLLTTPKHFAVHGAPLGGRDSHDIGLSEREIREIHLVPFRDIFKKYKYESIMMSYNDYLGVPVAGSKEILQHVLRDEWGFDGFIVSDCGAIGNMMAKKHYTATDKLAAAKLALAAGIATNCGDTYNSPEVVQAVKDGKVNMKDLDFACSSLLRVMFRNGYFENHPSKPLDWNKIYPGWNSPAHQAIARQVARESIVLLENKDQILPIAKDTKTIAVLGPGADDLQPGDYSPKLQPGQLKSVLTGIKEAVGASTKILYEKGCQFFQTDSTRIEQAVAIAQNADIVVMVLGDQSTSESIKDQVKTSGENHDLATLELQGDQQRLLEAVVATGKPVILILQAGRPYNLSYAKEHCAAIMVNWLPGQEGGPATADVLFGDYNPAGRLPVTFPQHVGQLPLYYNFKTSGRRYEYVDMEFYPLYKFGYGLSYTNFTYSNLYTQVQENGNIAVRAKITNTGKIAGDEVVQLYVTDMYASVKTRVMELKNFDRVHLQPGETKEVNFTLTPYEISLLNEHMDRVVEAGEFKIMVGGASPSFVAKDQIKNSLNYEDDSKGLVTTVDYQQNFAAKFDIRVLNIEKDIQDNSYVAHVEVKNTGNLTDVNKISLFKDGEHYEDRSFELEPQASKLLAFDIEVPAFKELQFVSKYKSITYKN